VVVHATIRSREEQRLRVQPRSLFRQRLDAALLQLYAQRVAGEGDILIAPFACSLLTSRSHVPIAIGIRRAKNRRHVGLRSYHRGMKLLRYRRPSLRNLSGYTQVKRRAKRQLGISQVQAWTKPSRVKQRAKQHVGYYSPTMRVVRNTAKGRFPSFLGLFRRK